jgi:hypothetical protein
MRALQCAEFLMSGLFDVSKEIILTAVRAAS